MDKCYCGEEFTTATLSYHNIGGNNYVPSAAEIIAAVRFEANLPAICCGNRVAIVEATRRWFEAIGEINTGTEYDICCILDAAFDIPQSAAKLLDYLCGQITAGRLAMSMFEDALSRATKQYGLRHYWDRTEHFETAGRSLLRPYACYFEPAELPAIIAATNFGTIPAKVLTRILKKFDESNLELRDILLHMIAARSIDLSYDAVQSAIGRGCRRGNSDLYVRGRLAAATID
ncbi:MAG: hypothetical protein WDA28_13215 [Castellaniella sp.]